MIDEENAQRRQKIMLFIGIDIFILIALFCYKK